MPPIQPDGGCVLALEHATNILTDTNHRLVSHNARITGA